jgi:glutamate/tyrosine decarboxylase-like PLP-dependent enzyme
MEEMVLKEMRKIVGYEDGKGDGIFCPGGSMANGYAISCARYNAFPDVKVCVFLVLDISFNKVLFSIFVKSFNIFDNYAKDYENHL